MTGDYALPTPGPRACSNEKNLLTYIACRQTLMTVARMARGLNRGEFDKFRREIVAEILALNFNADHADIWKQAVEGCDLSGLDQYALKTLGLHPTEKADVPEPEISRRLRRGTKRRVHKPKE